MDSSNKGKTIWEMLTERLRSHTNGSGLAFYNPLSQTVGAPVAVSCANGPEFAGYDFAVQEIREYNRQIGGQEFRFTDYVLRGTNTKSFSAEDALTVRVRALPNEAGSHDALLLRLYDEFAFAEDFLGVVKDTTGVFEATDDQTGATDTFKRINEIRDSWQAGVLLVSQTTADGKAAPGQFKSLKFEYWDYWRDAELGGGKSAKEFFFVEMNSDTGWFQLWRGREFFE